MNFSVSVSLFTVCVFVCVSSPSVVRAAELLGGELHLLLHGSDSVLLPVTRLQPSVHYRSLCILHCVEAPRKEIR